MIPRPDPSTTLVDSLHRTTGPAMRTVRLDDASLFEVATVVSLFVVALFGTAIAYQAYRGYERNESWAMLYLAVGLLLLTLFPFVLNVLLSTFTGVGHVPTVFAENVSRLLGLLAITYSLYGTH